MEKQAKSSKAYRFSQMLLQNSSDKNESSRTNYFSDSYYYELRDILFNEFINARRHKIFTKYLGFLNDKSFDEQIKYIKEAFDYFHLVDELRENSFYFNKFNGVYTDGFNAECYKILFTRIFRKLRNKEIKAGKTDHISFQMVVDQFEEDDTI